MKNILIFFLSGWTVFNWVNAQVYLPDSYKISKRDSILTIKYAEFQAQSIQNNQVFCIDLFEHPLFGNWLQIICSYEKKSNRVKFEGFWFRGGAPNPNDYKFENFDPENNWYVVSCMFCYLLHHVRSIQALRSELKWLKQHSKDSDEDIFAISLFLDLVELNEKSGSKIRIFNMENCPYIQGY